MGWLTQPWTDYGFFRHGLIAGAVAGALCGLIGVYVVLRRMSYIGHGLSHAIFGGAVVAYVLGINYYVLAGAWGVAAAVMIAWVGRRRQIGADAAIGVITTISFAIGVALISRVPRFSVNLEAALFGNILGVTAGQIWILVAVASLSVAVVFVGYRQLLFATFDPDVADAYGVSIARLDGVFSVLLAATVISTLQILGVTLIAATVVIPPVVARLLTDSFGKMLIISTILGTVGGIVGMYLSFYYDVASGSTIVLVAGVIFVLVFAGTAIANRRRLTALAGTGDTDVAGVPAHIG
jgi:ABC-type Mn2+/Zn2+ transport system permease subunit